MDRPDPHTPVIELVRAFAAQPDVVARLLDRHVPDERGRCRACTHPGTGTPMARWPCRLHAYADAAQQLLTGRG